MSRRGTAQGQHRGGEGAAAAVKLVLHCVIHHTQRPRATTFEPVTWVTHWRPRRFEWGSATGDAKVDKREAQQDPYNSDVSGTMRDYQATHSWIDFRFELAKLNWLSHFRVGEAKSKCDHLAGVALMPDVSQRLHLIYLVKGVLATTAIEGNTMTEDQVLARIEGTSDLPPSREYQGAAVDNIAAVCNEVLDAVAQGTPPEVSTELLLNFNERVLRGQELESHVIPGQIRRDSVGVGRYLAPPAKDCRYLLDELCIWINRPWIDDEASDELKFTVVLIKSILAHLYIAWIHPFGDGNGRTARLVEFLLLVRSGLPSPAAHLLSNHYNLTRDRYYQRLEQSSKGENGEIVFVEYAIEGLIDGLREQTAVVRTQQMEVTWINYVHGHFQDRRITDTQRRRRELVLSMKAGEAVGREAVPDLTPQLARLYANKQAKTVTRDLNALVEENLVRRTVDGFVPRTELVEAFLPLSMPNDEPPTH